MWRRTAVLLVGGIAAVAVVQVSGSGGAMALATLLYAAGVLFAFALDPDGPVLERATPGLYWIAVLFVTVLAVERSFSIMSRGIRWRRLEVA